MFDARPVLFGFMLFLIATTSNADELTHMIGETIASFDAANAKQAVAVDDRYVYAVNSFRITKHDKQTGEPLAEWKRKQHKTAIIHLDSGVVSHGRLYAAHSNWPHWPMTSSVEIWDTETMEHVGSHSFGIHRGSLTWLDRHDGFWWATFANYDRVQKGATEPYGHTANTQMVRMDDDFRILEAWVFPEDLLSKFKPMSNSGGSWGPDGRLYVTGHDLPEVYAIEIPDAGSTLNWVATLSLPDIEGQGIAWDRTAIEPILYGIQRSTRKLVWVRVSF